MSFFFVFVSRLLVTFLALPLFSILFARFLRLSQIVLCWPQEVVYFFPSSS